ncbi:MAG TPA: hypothetical protein VLE22_16980 [Bryobacteraceae bacterium]|nr:hypothetical protein [Bryobacteraceae bacterium]
MSVLRPRNRLVNFRLSQQEYETVKAVYAFTGARSISDFARTAVLRSAGATEASHGPAQSPLSNLEHKVAELESRVTSLIRLLNDGAES